MEKLRESSGNSVQHQAKIVTNKIVLFVIQIFVQNYGLGL